MAQGSTSRATANRILLTLPESVFDRLYIHLEPVPLQHAQIIYHANAPVDHLFFVDRGLVSLVKTMQDGRTVEIGAIGIEGVTGSNALFGLNAAFLETMVQVEGYALRIRRDILRAEMEKEEELRNLLMRYTHFVVNQFAQTAACNRLHSVEERYCRWLLISHDSARSDNFHLTHEFLAMMLGVQRSTVSLTAMILQKAGLIRYVRGRVTVTDRSGLEASACECYGTRRTQLRRRFGPT